MGRESLEHEDVLAICGSIAKKLGIDQAEADRFAKDFPQLIYDLAGIAPPESIPVATLRQVASNGGEPLKLFCAPQNLAEILGDRVHQDSHC